MVREFANRSALPLPLIPHPFPPPCPASAALVSMEGAQLIANPLVLLGVVDLALAVLLGLGMTNLYPFVRFRAAVGLGWVGFMSFGLAYWLSPRLFQTGSMAKPSWVGLHFWLGTIGILLYVIPIYAAGLTQGLMWRAFNNEGFLQFPDFIETVTILIPMYWFRVLGGTIYLLGALLCFVNVLMTWAKRPATYDVPVYEAAPLAKGFREHPIPGSSLPKGSVVDFAHKLNVFGQLNWHRKFEGIPTVFTVFVALGIVSASLFEIVPLFSRTSDITRIKSVTPYTPLELSGREIYIAEGCSNCHSQMIRPMRAETERYGEYSKPGESVYDHPFQWGSRRIGPDLAREGVVNPARFFAMIAPGLGVAAPLGR